MHPEDSDHFPEPCRSLTESSVGSAAVLTQAALVVAGWIQVEQSLNGSNFNYVFVARADNPQYLAQVTLTPRPAEVVPVMKSAQAKHKDPNAVPEVKRRRMSIRVILADDHVMIHHGLKVILETEGFQVVGEASNGIDAVGLCQKLRPDVAVLDISMPLLNGLDAARQITDEQSQIKVILLTAHTQDRYVLEGLRHGVNGYLSKENASDELVDAVRAVSGGAIYLTGGISRPVLRVFAESVNAQDADPLSARERQVLQLITEGKNMKEIGSLLGVSSRTADSHKASIMNKLAIHDVAGLVRFAIRTGLESVNSR